MKIRTLAAAAAVLSLATAPAVAEISFDRASAPADKKNELAGGSGLLIAIGAAAAVIAGIVIASDGDDDPVSP